MGSSFARVARSASRCAALLCLLWAEPGIADSIYTDDRVIHGRVVTLDEKAVVLRPGCDGPEQRLTWAEAREVAFNAQCNSPPVRLPSAGGGVCPSRPVQRFVVYFREQEAPVLADGVKLSADGTLHYDDQFKLKAGHGPLANVRGIARRAVCPDDTAGLSAPPAFCVEDKQFAVNFSYDTPLDNKVLTRGFSFFLETVPPAPERHEELRSLIRQGFGTALTSWMSELWSRQSRYDPALAKFLEGSVSRSASGYVMFLPPQVVALSCHHTATFIIRVYFSREGPFAPRSENVKAAFAAKPGRTILLNFADYACWEHAHFQFVLRKAPRCLNIVPVLIHELGHAFGLGHASEAGSIMSEIIADTSPAPGDLDRLAAQLLQSIQGEKAGQIEFVADNGVTVE